MTPADLEARDALAAGEYAAAKAHAAERWSRCCGARLDTRVPAVRWVCPLCSGKVTEETAVRWA